jgi:hypothetical protein
MTSRDALFAADTEVKYAFENRTAKQDVPMTSGYGIDAIDAARKKETAWYFSRRKAREDQSEGAERGFGAQRSRTMAPHR